MMPDTDTTNVPKYRKLYEEYVGEPPPMDMVLEFVDFNEANQQYILDKFKVAIEVLEGETVG